MPENATVYIRFSPELLDQLRDWSEPVRFKAEPVQGDEWTLILKTVTQAEWAFTRIMAELPIDEGTP